MTVPLMILAALSFAIIFTLPGVNPLHADGWFTRIIPQGENLTGFAQLGAAHLEHGFHEVHGLTMTLSFAVAGTGILLAIIFYLFRWLNAQAWADRLRRAGAYQLSFHKFYFDEIYDAIIYRPFLWLTRLAAWLDWEIWDQWFIDSWGRNTVRISNVSGYLDYTWLDQKVVDGFGHVIHWLGATGRKLQTGRIQNYIVWALAGGMIVFLVASSF